MRSTLRRSRISLPGIAFMIIGLGLVIFEMQTAFLQSRIGPTGRAIILICGTGFSVWGLKEVIAGLIPGLTKTGYSFQLPREGLIYLVIMCALFVGSLIGRNNLLLMVFACLAGPFVMNGWITFTMLRLLNVSRILPERIMAGEPFTTSIQLENRKSWLTIWLMTVTDSVTRGAEWLSPQVLFVRIPSKESRQGHYQLRLSKRGRYQFGPVTVTTRFPLGLVERGNRLDVVDNLLVYPRTGHLTPTWRKMLQNSTELVSDVRTVAGAFNDEMSRIREYRQGDDPRMIHWRTSARANELMVCEYEESRDRDLLLIIDGWLDSSVNSNEKRHQEKGSENFERGLCFATTVCMEHLRSSRISSLSVRIATDKIIDWRGDQGESHLEDLLDALAQVEPTANAKLDLLISQLDQGRSGKKRILILSARPEQVRKAVQNAADLRLADAQVYGTSAVELSPLFEENVEA